MTFPIALKHKELRTGMLTLTLSLMCMGMLRWGGESFLPFVGATAAVLIACIIYSPLVGFTALPPLLIATSYPPAFNDPGTLLFMALSAVWLGAELWQCRLNRLPRHPSWLWKITVIAGVLLAINFAVAIHHGIAAGTWLRGLYPFLLLGLLIPFLLRKYPNDVWYFLMAAVGVTCLILSAEILYIYCANRLWESQPVNSILVQQFLESPQGKQFADFHKDYNEPSIKFRITFLLPEAANLLPALGVVGWSLAAHDVSKRYRWLAIAAAATCFCAVIATATRSMIFCCGLSIALTLLIYYWNSRERIFESVVIGATVLALSLPFLLSTPAPNDLWLRNRELAAKGPKAEQDVGYRVQEYEHAWQAFLDAPLTGQGFGYAVDLVFPSGPTGKTVTVHATHVHNWVFYWLMVAGIPGLLMYSLLTFAPLVRLRGFRDNVHFPLTLVLAGSGILIASYGLFFAIYRTLPNVLCLTMLLGWVISNYGTPRNNS